MLNHSVAVPFLRWAGGKRKLVSRLIDLLPPNLPSLTYREPFLGGAALFLAVGPAKAIVSDANEHLIRCYKHVVADPGLVSRYLQAHLRLSSQDYYYEMREEYNRSRFSAAQAARFIYLNSTCFNGIFRVNKRGQFNVPYGWKEPPNAPTLQELRLAAAALSNARIEVADFEVALQHSASGEFIYLDPPYPPLNGTAYFTHYTPDRFGVCDQRRLARLFRDLDARGCVLMMTNADVAEVRKLYCGFQMTELDVTRYITCKKTKHSVRELVVTNYQPVRP